MVSDGDLAQRCEEIFMEMYAHEKCPVITIIHHVEQSFGLNKGTGIALFKQLVRNKSIELDLNKQIDLTEQRYGVHI